MLPTLPDPVAAPYPEAADHLRDELWEVWLRVEQEIRRAWELGTLPRVSDDAASGIWAPDELVGLFRAARAEHDRARLGGQDAGAAEVAEALRLHRRAVAARIEASRRAGDVPPLVALGDVFRLEPRQRAALACAVMAEIDPQLVVAFRYLSHEPTCRGLDGRLLAMLVYDTPESRALLSLDLSPASPLVHYRLLELDESRGNDALLYRRIRPAPRVVQLVGGARPELDPQLRHLATLVDHFEPGLFPPALVDRAAAALRATDVALVVQGQAGVGKRLLVTQAAAELGARALLVDGRQLAGAPAAEARPVLRALGREALLLGAVPVLVDVDDFAAGADGEELPPFVGLFLGGHAGPVALTVRRDRLPRIEARPLVHLELGVPPLDARTRLWRRHAPSLDEQQAVELAERFSIPGGTIAQAALAAHAASPPDGAPPRIEDLDRAVRNQLHGRILRLGRALEASARFDDLVVDDDVREALREIVASLRHRRRVRERWGFRGAHGVTVLFSGEPGVGKTMGATVVARELGLAIYEIDLSQVTSKWLGETEKNLAELFDAAEPGHVVLLFNEADSLFGKRTADVRSSNDRYANLETNYLLQRLERFGGLAILTTNLTGAIDAAFLRRFGFNVHFAFPTPEMRTELWRRAIPAQAETASIDFEALAAEYELSGGFIKVAAERAAFLAAVDDGPIDHACITTAIEHMYRERGKLTTTGRL